MNQVQNYARDLELGTCSHLDPGPHFVPHSCCNSQRTESVSCRSQPPSLINTNATLNEYCNVAAIMSYYNNFNSYSVPHVWEIAPYELPPPAYIYPTPSPKDAAQALSAPPYSSTGEPTSTPDLEVNRAITSTAPTPTACRVAKWISNACKTIITLAICGFVIFLIVQVFLVAKKCSLPENRSWCESSRGHHD